MLNRSIYDTQGIVNMHNWWMEILVGYGIIVFIMYIIFFCKLLIHLIKKYKLSRNRIDYSVSLGMIFSMTGFIIGSTSSSSNLNSEWLWVFWAIVIAYQGIEINSLDYSYEKECQIKISN
jgi:teichuronic acid biosynthesis protein TuaE